MDETISAVKARLRDRLRELDADVDRIQRERSDIQIALRVLEGGPGAPSPNGHNREASVSLPDAVDRVLREADRPLSYSDVIKRITSLGLSLSGKPDENKVGVAVARVGNKRGWGKMREKATGRIVLFKRAGAGDPGHLENPKDLFEPA